MSHWSLQAPWSNPVLAAEIRGILLPRADAIRDDYENTFSYGAIESLVGRELYRRLNTWMVNLNVGRDRSSLTLDEGVEAMALELAKPYMVLVTPDAAFLEHKETAQAFVKSTMEQTLCYMSRTEQARVLQDASMARTWRKKLLDRLTPYNYSVQGPHTNGLRVGDVMVYLPWQRDEEYWSTPTMPYAHARNLFTQEVT